MAKQPKRPTKAQKETIAAVADQPLTFESPESSLVIRGAYDPRTQTLTAEFISGRTYSYADVSPELWTEMLAAESKGRFFNSRIRPVILGHEVK